MIGHLAETIAAAAIAAVGLAVERWRESAAFRAAKLEAWLGLDDAERRSQHKPPRRWWLKRRRAKNLLATAIAYEKVTKDQCDCLEQEVAKRVADAGIAAIDAAKRVA